MTIGTELIANERRRQIDAEGWTTEHDDAGRPGSLVAAALAYADRATDPGPHSSLPPSVWPWAPVWWKPSADPIRNLVKAGALIAAEIDRLVRCGP